MKQRATNAPSRLDPELAAFIQGGVSVVIASSNARLEPDVVRGCGCRVSRDRRRVTVLFDLSRGDRILQDCVVSRQIAVVFTQPSTHRTIQLKGTDAATVRTAAADRAVARDHRERWIQELVQLGYTLEFSAAIWGSLPTSLAAIAFTPTSAYQQTPGPTAGQPLGR